MLGRRKALDRRGVDREGSSPRPGDSRQRSQNTSRGGGQQLGDLLVSRFDIALEQAPALQVAAQTHGPQLGVGRRRQEGSPPRRPAARICLREAPRGAGDQRARRRGTPSELDRAGQHRLARGVFELERPAVTARRREPRAKGIKLVVETLLGALCGFRPKPGDDAPRQALLRSPRPRAGDQVPGGQG